MSTSRTAVDPAKDGVDHINIYSKGKTELGRWLSNFARTPIETEDGHFESVEGYWYWLTSTHPARDLLRSAAGWHAKALGRQLDGKDWCNTDTFQRKIKAAVSTKVNANPAMRESLVTSTLPFTHYYVYGTQVIEVREVQWLIDHIDSLRKAEG